MFFLMLYLLFTQGTAYSNNDDIPDWKENIYLLFCLFYNEIFQI